MKKRIIFDLDNTIIIWKESYISALEETIDNFNVNVDVKVIDNLIENLEKNYEKISKEILLSEINKSCNLKLDINFINMLFEKQSLLAEIDKDVYDTLNYLSKKYELVILTNYFREVQENRLKKVGIRKFFKEIYSGEYAVKPNKKAFHNAMGNYDINSCIMIGDSINADIKGALNIGMDVIAVDYFNKIDDNNNYKVIRDFKELQNIL